MTLEEVKKGGKTERRGRVQGFKAARCPGLRGNELGNGGKQSPASDSKLRLGSEGTPESEVVEGGQLQEGAGFFKTRPLDTENQAGAVLAGDSEPGIKTFEQSPVTVMETRGGRWTLRPRSSRPEEFTATTTEKEAVVVRGPRRKPPHSHTHHPAVTPDRQHPH